LGASLGVLGAQRMLPSLNPETLLYRQADSAALAWIQENIPPDETIVINPTGWGYGLYMGSDGGFWISPLIGRQTMPPNVMYGMDRANRDAINQFVETLLPIAEDPPALWDLLRSSGYRYIYIGVRGGAISPQSLRLSPLFTLRYAHQGTWVFEANPLE
ncbi:MAG: hypothetical protein MUO62_19175, partial [Anaerolineales bacterium]|nr:hypothetical protein [Anaerolineales bacterium]